MSAASDHAIDHVPKYMAGVHLTGHGGFESLVYRTDIPVPKPAAGEVLVRVGAAGVNNTDINTRIGWYSKSVTSGTSTGGGMGYGDDVSDDGGWSETRLEFPRIQGADAAGKVVVAGPDVDQSRVGQRVLVRSMQAPLIPAGLDVAPSSCVTMGSEFDGAFAQYCAVRETEAFEISSTLSDVELASFPCAYSTAEGMLHRVELTEGETVLITGASGGVGSAAVQLAKRRGAMVLAVASESKWAQVRALGADSVIDRDAELAMTVGPESVDVVVDVVAGPAWPALLEVLRTSGRYVTAGAIAGPIVELDVRTLYLKDLTLMGCTFQPRAVFENLVNYIERGEISPLVAGTYPLDQIVQAQTDFLAKSFVGKLVLIPPTGIAE